MGSFRKRHSFQADVLVPYIHYPSTRLTFKTTQELALLFCIEHSGSVAVFIVSTISFRTCLALSEKLGVVQPLQLIGQLLWPTEYLFFLNDSCQLQYRVHLFPCRNQTSPVSGACFLSFHQGGH